MAFLLRSLGRRHRAPNVMNAHCKQCAMTRGLRGGTASPHTPTRATHAFVDLIQLLFLSSVNQKT